MASLRLELGLAYGAADGIEVPLHHDQLGDFHDGVDVGLLHETLGDADFDEVEGRLGGLIRNDAGVLVAGEASLFRDREEAQSAGLVRSLRNGAVAATLVFPRSGSSWIGAPPTSSTGYPVRVWSSPSGVMRMRPSRV